MNQKGHDRKWSWHDISKVLSRNFAVGNKEHYKNPHSGQPFLGQIQTQKLPSMKQCQPIDHDISALLYFNIGSHYRKNAYSCILWSLQSGKRAKTCLLHICDKLFTYASSVWAMVELANWQKITLILAAEAQTNLNNQLTSTLHRRLT